VTAAAALGDDIEVSDLPSPNKKGTATPSRAYPSRTCDGCCTERFFSLISPHATGEVAEGNPDADAATTDEDGAMTPKEVKKCSTAAAAAFHTVLFKLALVDPAVLAVRRRFTLELVQSNAVALALFTLHRNLRRPSRLTVKFYIICT
jgi:hypothetical protein